MNAKKVIIDPGIPFIHIPKADFEKIYTQLTLFLKGKGLTVVSSIKDRLKIR